MKETANLSGRPLITFFMKASPHHDRFLEDEAVFASAIWSPVTGVLETDKGEPLWAALYKSPPTSCTTPGKTRPGGYNKSGKYILPKFIPAKTDKRAGK